MMVMVNAGGVSGVLAHSICTTDWCCQSHGLCSEPFFVKVKCQNKIKDFFKRLEEKGAQNQKEDAINQTKK